MMSNSPEFSRLGWEAVNIPLACRNENIIIGIDEAGRGPVLGSLIYCAAFWPSSLNEQISKLGFDDSKVLSAEDRDKLFLKIRNHGSIGWVIQELSATKISEDMLRANPISLNKISYDSVVRALEVIRDASPNPPVPEHVYVDTVGDPDYYKSVLIKALGNDFSNFTIEKKADAKYKVVSAASIIAKVTRDALLKMWQDETAVPLDTAGGAARKGTGEKDNKRKVVDVASEEELEEADLTGELDSITDSIFGSGYPGDPQCVEWLGRNMHPVFGFPDIVRFSWSTTRSYLVANNACTVAWPCDQEERAGADIASMFSAKIIEKKKIRRCRFRQAHAMEHFTKSDFLAGS